SYHSRCTRQPWWDRPVQLHAEQWAQSDPGQHHLQPWTDCSNLYIYLERRTASRSYLPWTWWYPGDQSQSTDFSTGWTNGHVQLTRIVRAALAVALTIVALLAVWGSLVSSRLHSVHSSQPDHRECHSAADDTYWLFIYHGTLLSCCRGKGSLKIVRQKARTGQQHCVLSSLFYGLL